MSTVVENKGAKVSLAEKILFIVLAVIIVVLIAFTVLVIVKWHLLLKRTRADVLDDTVEDAN